MANVYACPVHVDQQGNDPNRACPLCGQRVIVLRAEPVSGEGPLQPAPAPAPAPAPQPTPEPPSNTPPPDLIAELDQVIALVSQIRDRLLNLA